MRIHIQGFLLLGFLLASIWGAVQLASPSLSEALGEEGALQAESREDTVDLALDAPPEEPLTQDELMRLQFNLLRGGFFADLDAVDGVWGPNTREKMAEAAQAWGLDEPSDREIFEHAESLFADQPFLGG
ncbi:MAG: hypothetical protein AAF548_07685 [Actinomycetota bacterium]